MKRQGGTARRWISWIGVVLWVLLWVGHARAQQESPRDKLLRAFTAGDAQILLEEAADRVEIALLGRTTLYSRAQATYVLQSFFQEHPPQGLSIQDHSLSDNHWLATGLYTHQKETEPFDVYVRFRLKEEKWELRELRIEQRRQE